MGTVATPIYFLTRNRLTTLRYILLVGLCEPLGALLIGRSFTKRMLVIHQSKT